MLQLTQGFGTTPGFSLQQLLGSSSGSQPGMVVRAIIAEGTGSRLRGDVLLRGTGGTTITSSGSDVFINAGDTTGSSPILSGPFMEEDNTDLNDGTQVSWSTARLYQVGSLQVFVGGLKKRRGAGLFFEEHDDQITYTLGSPVPAGTEFVVTYFIDTGAESGGEYGYDILAYDSGGYG